LLLRRSDLPIRMHQSLIRHGRDEHRKLERLAEERGRGVEARGVAQNTRAQCDSLKCFAIPTQRDFIRRAAGEKLIRHVRQTFAHQRFEVVE
jgi:hypothetical protein